MYGRRLRMKRAPRRLASSIQSAIPRPTGPRDSEQIASILNDYASGELPRVPRSAYCLNSSSATLQRYGDIIERIVRSRRYVTRWRAEKVREWRDEATSHIDRSRNLTESHNLLGANKAMRELLKKAAISLRKINLVEQHYDLVFVYDIGEITMLTKNYIAEFTTMYPEIDSYSLFKFTEKVLNSVDLTREELAKKTVISMYDEIVDDDVDYWNIVAPKYAALEELYDEISTAYKKGDPAISQELCNKCGIGGEIKNLRKTAAQLQKKVHQRWRRVEKCLDFINQKSRVSPGKYANVVLCEETVGSAASEILVSGHSSYIPLENIYSMCTLDRDAVFKKLESRFGDTCVFVYVSSPQTFGVPKMRLSNHWPVEAAESIKKLYKAQRNYLF